MISLLLKSVTLLSLAKLATSDFAVSIQLIKFCDNDGLLLNRKRCDELNIFGRQCDIELEICVDNIQNNDLKNCVSGWKYTRNTQRDTNCHTYQKGKRYGSWQNPSSVQFTGPYNGANLKVIAKDYNFGAEPDSLIDQFVVQINASPVIGTQTITVNHARPGGLKPTTLVYEVTIICTNLPVASPHCLGSTTSNLFTSPTTVYTSTMSTTIPAGGQDCAAIKRSRPNAQSGVYQMILRNQKPFSAYCDMDTLGGGWTVFQSRSNGGVSFNQKWNQYKAGFGNVANEHWLGNEHVHLLTNSGLGTMELMVELRPWGQSCWLPARYSSFSLGSESTSYQLSLGRFSGGLAGDSLRESEDLNNKPFGTPDHGRSSCPTDFNSGCGWWWKSCATGMLNGPWPTGNTCPSLQVAGTAYSWWDGVYNGHQFFSGTQMKIRPVNFK